MSKTELKQISRFKFQRQQLLFLLTVRILEDKVWWLESYEFFWCRPPFLGNIGSSFLHLWGHFHHWFSICVARGLRHIPQIEAMQLVNVKGQLKYLSLMNIFFIYLPKEGALTLSIRQLEPSGPAITLFLIHAIIYTYGHLQSLVDWSYIHLQSSKRCKGELDTNGCLIANAMLLYLSPNLAIHHFFDEMTCL